MPTHPEDRGKYVVRPHQAVTAPRNEDFMKAPVRPRTASVMVASMFVRCLAVAAALAGSLITAPSALAVISSPPAFPREVTVFPMRDFVTVDGWPANTDVRVDVLRNGVNVGTA